MKYIVFYNEKKIYNLLAGKALALAKLSSAGFSVPYWFAVLPQALYDSATKKEMKNFTNPADPSAALKILSNLTISNEVLCELDDALNNPLFQQRLFAVRSSASDEDSAKYSFAGQLETFLFVRSDQVRAKIIEVWRSGFSDNVFAYRKEHNITTPLTPPLVIVQQMVNPSCAGVAFSADPVSGKRGVTVVSAVYGLGSSLVSGETDADTYKVNRDGEIIEQQIAKKEDAHCYINGSVQLVIVPAERKEQPVLSGNDILAIAELTRAAEKFFCSPQDIEWAMENENLFILQSRPITSIAAVPDPDGGINIWDNSNIAESYGGVTTPMTFSFALKAYEEVYRQFCRIMNVPADIINENQNIFKHMLGLIKGRIYYNLLNWYRLLSMLPGFKTNSSFMEQMMGVKETIPSHILNEQNNKSSSSKISDIFNLLITISGMISNCFLIDKKVKIFFELLKNTLGQMRHDLSRMRPDELVNYYRYLEKTLLTKWDTPILNDFFAMVFYGLLGKVCKKWCSNNKNGNDSILNNDLISGEGGIISSEPALRITEMAMSIKNKPDLIELLCNGELENILLELGKDPNIAAQYRSYLEKFGDRCADELKLESITLYDNPLPLLRSIGELARNISADSSENPGGLNYSNHESKSSFRKEAEMIVKKALALKPFHYAIFQLILKNARKRIRDRENLRFERTKVFGRVRMILLELGKRFYSLNLLEDPKDIFYLELNEVLGYVEGTSTCINLKNLAASRKDEFNEFKKMDPPPDRFETYGAVYQNNIFTIPTAEESFIGEEKRGIGCCPGKVLGRVKIVKNPLDIKVDGKAILVAERTDPSWIMIFPFASALLVEHGSLLSHSAIVAREMCIPAIVSISGITHWLKDDDLVEIDGRTGVVKKIINK